jgi:hypothetical protein
MSIVTYNNRSIANISAIPGAAKALTHIKTLTASSSATLSFVNGSSDVVLDSTYPIYKFVYTNMHPSGDGEGLKFQASTNTGSSYGVSCTNTAFRSQHNEADSTAALDYDTGNDLANGTGFFIIAAGTGNDNDQSNSGELTLFNPSSTTFVKHYLATSNANEDGDASKQYLCAGYFNTTSAIDAVQFKFGSGNIDAGTIKLYGIKDS